MSNVNNKELEIKLNIDLLIVKTNFKFVEEYKTCYFLKSFYCIIKKVLKMSSDALNISRRKLNDALGDKSTKYFNHMKQWFRMKLTKEEFDTEARALLNPDQVHYHNEFLLALLNKVEGLAETSISIAQEKGSSHNRNSRRHKRNSRTSEKSNFEPADLIEYLPPNSPPGAGSDGVKYATQVSI